MNKKLFGAINWKLIGVLALAVVVIVALLATFGNGTSLLAYLPYLLLLACPLMMIFMMGSMGHHGSGPHALHDGVHNDGPDIAGLTRDEQVWALRNELTRMAWHQEALRQDLERLEHERVVDADEAARTR
jgi:uncharacterized membrane protein YuzA (DUF378 family)